MPKGRKRTEAEKTAQKNRTSQNQLRKYMRLLEKFPTSRDVDIWKKKIENLK